MASSDDEEDHTPHLVTHYYFEDGNKIPISFSVLPIWLDGKEKPDAPEDQVCLRGAGDGGRPVYIQVTAYRLGLEDVNPEIMVLTKDRNKWIKLLKPRKSYEESFRSILITIHLLHFLRRNVEASEKSLWDHLRKAFSSFEQLPSPNDLLDHYPLIKLLVDSDNMLAKCQLLLSLLKDKPRKKILGVDPKSDLDSKKSFIVDDLEDDLGNNEDDSEDEFDLFDSVCAICDNGGVLLCCEGRCMRSFHATREDGEESDCKSLGYSKTQVEAIQNFVCKNCKHKRHQCYVCGKLGSSDKSSGAEVFSCVNATCGYFYHPKCVSDLLFPDNETQAAEYEKKIASGESFTCPAHKCHVCKQGENKEVEKLQFAVCRRCPRSYHRKCLPRKIAFDDSEDDEIETRAWDDLLPNRILIYCLKHKIDADLGTPKRNHIVFPQTEAEIKALNEQKNNMKVLTKRKFVSNDKQTFVKTLKQNKSISNSGEKIPPILKCGERSNAKQALNLQKQLKPTKADSESQSDILDTVEIKKSIKGKAKVADNNIMPASGGKVINSSYPKVDVETEKKIAALMASTSSSITLTDIIKKRKMPSIYSMTSRNSDRNIPWGRLEGSVEAVKTALKKIEDGGSVEDAKAVCEPKIIKQIMTWHNRLRVYLAPFIHANRYTSYGRHFTKVDKLSWIVDKLQWYVRDDDMIVDFCCGANDFSRLMKEKLDSVGKKCSYKNYDIIQPKFDFNFEKRDWMTVQPNELPSGSRLIMGLNPPFGLKGALANKFIDKALTFRPKLIILIVPSETERLDKKKQSPYDIIWEDSENLSGKSFYLPGSVDVHDLQMEQWNNEPPPLYLWSRPDWTANHMAIASKQGHISKLEHEFACEEKPKPQKMNLDSDDISENCKNEETTMKDDECKIAAELKMRSHSQKREDYETDKKNNKNRIAEESKKKSRSPEIQKSNINKNIEIKKNIAKDDKNKLASGSKKRSRSPENCESNKLSPEKKRSCSPDNHIPSKSSRKQRARRRKKSEKRKERELADATKEHGGSNMSISPSHVTKDADSQINSEKFETPGVGESIRTFSNDGNGCKFFEAPRVTESFQTYADRQSKQSSIVKEDIYDLARRYTTDSIIPSNRDVHYSSTSNNWSSDRTFVDRDYQIRNLERSFPAYSYDNNINNNGNYNSYNPANRFGDYGRIGHNDIPTPSSYGLSSSSAAGSSVMDRYAPRLDEMNFSRGVGHMGPGVPGGVNGSTMSSMGPGPFGFAPGPQHGFQHHNSGGWLDD